MAPGAGGRAQRLEPRGALLASLSEQGQIDWPAIASLSGRSEAQAQMELMAVGAVFRDPDSGGWQTREAYLSGNVRARLRAAQEAARLNPSFESNVEALKKVQPEELKPGEIYAPLGAGWIPMNQGQVRVLLASTGMAGEGANFQRLLAALHHLDTPWTPARIRQREGRILRQGNLNAAVEVYRYVTEGSSDAYRWQTVERKALSADQVLSGQIATRSTEDIDAVHFDYGVVKALASNNPVVMERVRLQTELQRYQALRRVYQSRRFEAQQALDIAQQELASLRQNDPASERIPELTEEIAQHRTTLRQPFEYEQKIVEVQAALGQVELEIARLNRPVRRKRGGLIARLFGIGGRA